MPCGMGPGSNVTLAATTRVGSFASNSGSMRTLPVKYSARPYGGRLWTASSDFYFRSLICLITLQWILHWFACILYYKGSSLVLLLLLLYWPLTPTCKAGTRANPVNNTTDNTITANFDIILFVLRCCCWWLCMDTSYWKDNVIYKIIDNYYSSIEIT